MSYQQGYAILTVDGCAVNWKVHIPICHNFKNKINWWKWAKFVVELHLLPIIILMMGLHFPFFLKAYMLFISCSYFVSLISALPSLDNTTLWLLVLIGVILYYVHLVGISERTVEWEDTNRSINYYLIALVN